ncbi:MAG: hypothetical protein Unbinned6284contig1004_25 [Prokaryotic dsDNA virus sp.]|nr:MAG: hypothetical protein Unbinned6284contig1004_25 [Prokaryotic dsDNA virus sp.]|tara:strand:- start:32839 stop:33240 length:402 start_codon:yes stop_codon:yes gene_type:complete
MKVYCDKCKAEMDKTPLISRKMQEFYYSCILTQVLEFNLNSGVLKDGTTGMLYETVNELDYLLRYYFYYKHLNINGIEVRMPKTLKLSKADRKDVCLYFDRILRYFQVKHNFTIQTPEDDYINKLIAELDKGN